MKNLMIIALCAIATPAAAELVEIKNCRLQQVELMPINRVVTCDITNLGQVPIASMAYRVLIGQVDRTVPWVDKARSAEIAGGIEPGETVPVDLMLVFHLPDHADQDQLTVAVTAESVSGVDGQPIK